ncbi:hypothetical protein MVEG_06075 [Podila verticillata NRRL 6337]|nr:hypothetical protein MVEG_06075 [Podila verticillata NRRL 6337]
MEARKRRSDLMEEQHTSKRQTRSSASQAALGLRPTRIKQEPEPASPRRQLRRTETPPRPQKSPVDDPAKSKARKATKPVAPKKTEVVSTRPLEQAKAPTQSKGVGNPDEGAGEVHVDKTRLTEGEQRQAEETRVTEEKRREEACRQIERLLQAEENRRIQEEQRAEEKRQAEEGGRAEVDQRAEEEGRTEEDRRAEAERLTEENLREEAKRIALEARRLVEVERLAKENVENEKRQAQEEQQAQEVLQVKEEEEDQTQRAEEGQRDKEEEEEEEKRQAEEEQRAKEEEDEKRQAEEARSAKEKAADEKRRVEEEKRAKEKEEDKKRRAEEEERAKEKEEAKKRRAEDGQLTEEKKLANKTKVNERKRKEPTPTSGAPAPRRSLRAHVQKRRFIDESEEEMDSDDYIDSDEDSRKRSDDGREEEEENDGSGYESGEDVERGEWDWGERVPRPSASDHAHKMWLQQHSTKIAAKCDELAQRGLSKVTRVLYAPGLVRWEEFCDEHYSGNYLIRPPKVAHFLKDRIFNASTKARVKGPNHDGAIGRTKADPAVDPEAAKAEAAKIRNRFNAAMREYEDSGYYFYLPPSEQSVHACMNILAHEWRFQTDKGKNNAQRPSHAQIVIQAIEGYLRSLVRTSGVTTATYTGRRSSESSNKTKRRYVRKAGPSAQTKTTTTVLNRATPFHRYKSIPISPREKRPPMSRSEPSLRSNMSSTKASSEGSAATREAMYNAADFLRMMDVFWELPVETGLRDRAAFSLRHQLFLQDQDHRQLDLADCFSESFEINLRGNPYRIHGMALAMRGGAILPDGNTPVAIALRHKDFRRCSVGASLQEPLPDFTNSTEWPQFKLLKGAKRLEEVSYSSLYSGTLYAFKASGIDLHRFTLRGSDAGAKELYEMGFHIQKPARISPKGVEIRGTMAMAGFPNAPYDLKRDYLLPPRELQIQIFPMIEQLHGKFTLEEWKAYCDNVMQDKNATSTVDKRTVREQRIAAGQVSHESYLETARLNLLHFLLWCRRVILQDTCLFLKNGDVNGLIMSPVFQSPEFEKFKTDLLKAMDNDAGPTRDYGEGPVVFKNIEAMEGVETTSEPSTPARGHQRDQQEQREQWRPVRQQERQLAKEKERTKYGSQEPSGPDYSSRESMNSFDHQDPLELEESDDGDEYEEYEDCEEYMDDEPRDVRDRLEPQVQEARQEQLKEYLQDHLQSQLQDYMHQQLQDFMNQQLQDHLQDQHQMYQSQMEPLHEQLEEQAEQLRQLQIQVHQNQQAAQQQIREIQLQALEQKHTLYSIVQDLREDLQEVIHSSQVDKLEFRDEVQRVLRTKQAQMTRQLEDHCRAMTAVLGGSDVPLSPLSQATADEAGALASGVSVVVPPPPPRPAALITQSSSISSSSGPSGMGDEEHGQGHDQEQGESRSSSPHESSLSQHRPQPSLSFRQYGSTRR